MGVTVKKMSHDNVWEGLLEQCVFQLLPESGQRLRWRGVVGQTVRKLCCCDRKRSTADGWQFERRNPQTIRSCRAECWSTRHVADMFTSCSLFRHTDYEFFSSRDVSVTVALQRSFREGVDNQRGGHTDGLYQCLVLLVLLWLRVDTYLINHASL